MCECVDYYDERYGASRYLCEVCFAEYEEIKAERDRLREIVYWAHYTDSSKRCSCQVCVAYRTNPTALKGGDDD